MAKDKSSYTLNMAKDKSSYTFYKALQSAKKHCDEWTTRDEAIMLMMEEFEGDSVTVEAAVNHIYDGEDNRTQFQKALRSI